MDVLQPLLEQLSALSPAWAVVVGLVTLVLRQNGWLRMPAGADPLKVRLQEKIGTRYDELSSGGESEEAFYWLLTQVRRNPGDTEPKEAKK